MIHYVIFLLNLWIKKKMILIQSSPAENLQSELKHNIFYNISLNIKMKLRELNL